MPAFITGPPTKQNWSYVPSDRNPEIKTALKRVEYLTQRGFRGEDMVCTFTSCRVLTLQGRAHKICYMAGRMDPTRTSTFVLDNDQIWQRSKAIAQIRMPEWEWGKGPTAGSICLLR